MGFPLGADPSTNERSGVHEVLELLDHVHAFLEQCGLPPLTWNARLKDGALAYARLLGTSGESGHEVGGTTLIP